MNLAVECVVLFCVLFLCRVINPLVNFSSGICNFTIIVTYSESVIIACHFIHLWNGNKIQWIQCGNRNISNNNVNSYKSTRIIFRTPHARFFYIRLVSDAERNIYLKAKDAKICTNIMSYTTEIHTTPTYYETRDTLLNLSYIFDKTIWFPNY